MFRNPVTDLIVVVVVALLIFGPKRLPMLGRALGHGFREFKEGIPGQSNPDAANDRPALTSAVSTDPASEPAPAAVPPTPTSTPVAPESAEAGSVEHRS